MPDGRTGRDAAFDLLVVGAGQAGIPLAHALAKKGWRVMLAERKDPGGSCVNFGCTPTKAALASARAAQLARRAGEFGIRVPRVTIDFGAVLGRAHGIAAQSRIALRESLVHAHGGNPEYVNAHARFAGRDGRLFRVDVGGRVVLARRVVLDTGTRTLVPRGLGLEGIDFLHAGNWLHKPALPRHLVVVGGSYVGLEMSQFYRRMGSRVTLLERGARLAGREDEDVSRALRGFLECEGITCRLGAPVTRVEKIRGGVKVSYRENGRPCAVTASHVFLAAGRRPNTDDLGLSRVGLAPERDGTLRTDRRLGTRVRGVWAAGDIRGGPMFTHTAWDDYRILLSQLAGDGTRTTDRIVPWAVYTDPQLGRVGLSEEEAKRLRRAVNVGRFPMSKNGKAREIGESEGFVKVVVDARTGKLLGATVLAAEGAELVHVFVALMNAGARASAIRDAICIHPTLAEALQSAVAALR
jgi:pyruvate/2-oxoglutarate dehydrogenase complex dihydrolipoamide dehydrogenase (E3) component